MYKNALEMLQKLILHKQKPYTGNGVSIEENILTPYTLKPYDVIIVGGGPAGMSAALILARSRRNILIFDTGKQRNRMSHAMHGYLTRDGIAPPDFLKLAREEIKAYNITVQEREITFAAKRDQFFELKDDSGNTYRCRKLLLATGLVDKVPQIEGIEEMYGISVHHCPYCDGWEKNDKRIVVFGRGKAGYALSSTMLNWSNTVMLCTNGGKRPKQILIDELHARGVEIYTGRIAKLEGRNGQLERIIFRNGAALECDAMFFTNGYLQHSSLGKLLNAKYNHKNEMYVDHVQQSSVPGLYVSGDAAHEMKLVIIAAGEGAKAAVAINVALMEEDCERLVKREKMLLP